MDTLLNVCGVAVLFVANVLVMYLLAWFLTSVITLPMKFKPFNCRPCLAFWLTLVGGIVIAFIVAPHTPVCREGRGFLRWWLIGVAFLTAIIHYQYLKIKFKVYA